MLPYWMLFSAYAFGAVTNQLRPRGTQGIAPLLMFVSLMLALFVGLRYEVGADWIAYNDILAVAGDMSLGEILAYSDPAYMLLNGLAQWLGADIWFVNLACAVVFTWGLLQFAQRQPNPWLAVAVAVPYLVIVVAMGYTRQGVAIGLIMAAIGPFEHGKYGRFLALMILAAAFHKTSIVTLPLIVLSSVRHRLAIYTVAGVVGALLFALFLQAFVENLTSNYIGDQMDSSGAAVRVAMNVVPAAVYLLFAKRFVLDKQERALWRNFAVAALAMVLGLAASASTTAVDRMALYMMPIQIFALSRLPYAFPTRGRANMQLLIGVLAYSAAIQAVWLIFASHANLWVPYQMFSPFGE